MWPISEDERPKWNILKLKGPKTNISLFTGLIYLNLVFMISTLLNETYGHCFGLQMAQLAKACTQDNPQLRPSMRSIVVALMTLSSTTDDWDVGSFYENQNLVNLMSGR